MQSIKFLGAAGTVTGSGYLYQSYSGNILIDLGMFQGLPEVDALNYDPLEIDIQNLRAVILTHAHLDHCGRLPLLVKKGYRGNFYMTEATRTLAEITLFDTAKIARFEEKQDILYGEREVIEVLKRTIIANYDQSLSLDSIDFKFLDAGHILGSASVVLTDNNSNSAKHIAFSGDLGNSPQDIVRPTQMVDQADVVVMESTYGDRNHPEEDSRAILQEEINKVEQSGGTLLIPAFSLERTQVLLSLIRELKAENKVGKNTVVILDSPMGIDATNVYRSFVALYNKNFADIASKGDPFGFPGLVETDKAGKSNRIMKTKGAKVIIAGAGMMTGGRILGHAARSLPNPTTRLLIVGYVAEETLGREIKDGAREVYIDGKPVKIRANVREISGLSAHADQAGLLKWFGHIKGAKKVFLTHGEDFQRSVLGQKIKELNHGVSVALPHLNENYPIADM